MAIAAGSLGRDYTDRFLRHGMAFVGGDTPCSTMDDYLQLGDKIILKRGMSQMSPQVVWWRAMTSSKETEIRNGCAIRWLDLSAWCYVDWCIPSEPIQTNGLTRATIQGVSQPHLLVLAENIFSSNPAKTTYEAEPPDTRWSRRGPNQRSVQLDCPGAAEELTQALRRIRLLARFYLVAMEPNQRT